MVDENGANEVFNVNLTPKNWAGLCKKKSEGWFARNGEYSLDQLDAEIARLERLRISYDAMAATMGIGPDKERANTGGSKYPVAVSDEKKPDLDASNEALKKAFQDVYEAEGELAGDNKKLRELKMVEKGKDKGDADGKQSGGDEAAKEDGDTEDKKGDDETQAGQQSGEPTKKGLQDKKTKSENTLKERRQKLAAPISTSQEDQVAYNKATMANMSDSKYDPVPGAPLWNVR